MTGHAHDDESEPRPEPPRTRRADPFSLRAHLDRQLEEIELNSVAAPEIVDLEMCSTLRRLLQAQRIDRGQAEQLDVPLVTCDAKLAGSNGHKAEIELYSTN